MKRGSSGRRGFSMVEVLVSSAVLGVALMGLLRLQGASVRGVSRSRTTAFAEEVATQRLEVLNSITADALILPSCPLSGLTGCMQNIATYAPSKTCTAYVSTPDVPTPSGVTSAVTTPTTNAFRVDTVIQRHPDTVNHPDSLLTTVSVCWSDERLNVHQVQMTRLFVPGA